MRFMFPLLATFLVSFAAHAGQNLAPRGGWAVINTDKDFQPLVKDTRTAVIAQGLIVLTQADPTAAAKKRGITIPGNRMIGVFNNDFAVRVLETSNAAMIEAPIRLYVTDNSDGTATLYYKTPTTVFTPYIAEGGAPLVSIAAELDQIFQHISKAVGA
jgi:uncharacterized protein (DUF302 family)|tara:strand:- start:7397 stop:7870 length:474 start_codon:yes stop_codon:yes gene_type:complete